MANQPRDHTIALYSFDRIDVDNRPGPKAEENIPFREGTLNVMVIFPGMSQSFAARPPPSAQLPLACDAGTLYPSETHAQAAGERSARGPKGERRNPTGKGEGAGDAGLGGWG